MATHAAEQSAEVARGRRIGRPPVAPEIRFWAKVEKTATCWRWTGHLNHGGYGEIWVSGHQIRAHRFSYELANGPIPNGFVVCHRCDHPWCVNPERLFLGTDADNVRDCVQKGRHMTCKQGRTTRCKHGHAWTPETTRWRIAVRHDRGGVAHLRRDCLVCEKLNHVRSHLKRSHQRAAA